MYGLEGILGNLVTSVATPAIGGLAGEAATGLLKDVTENELLKEITQTTVGALSGAAVGAGLGALTGGGGAGALSGALTGGVGGGLGGYHAQDIAPMFGGAGPQQSVVAPQAGQPLPSPQNALQQTAAYKGIGGIGSPSAYGAAGADLFKVPDMANTPEVNIPGAKLDAASSAYSPPSPAPSEYKGYIDFLKKNYEPLAGGFFLGSSYGASQDTKEQGEQRQHEQILKDLIEQQQAKKFGRSIWGYADGGPVEVGLADPQISVHFPAWAQEQIQREGGLAALQPGIKQGMANGGYVNVHPFDPQDFHPQSQIPSAQPYAGSAPTSVINTLANGASFARGGLIDGHGDGMSDSIPANIDGREPVKVADGEYVIPRDVAHKYGPEKLKRAMTKIRAAAHAKKGKQIVQGAAQRALIQSLTGVRA